MKKLIQLFTLCLIIASCDFEKITDLQNDFEIKVSAEAVFSKVHLKFYNAKDGLSISENLDLNLSGSDAHKIYTVNGTRDYKIENGFITLGITRNATVTSENPINATAIVSANGYITKMQEISFDGSDIQEVQISLLEKANLPKTVALESVTKSLIDNKTTEEILIEVTSKTDSENSVRFIIPEGTEFEDEVGNLVSGEEVTINLQTFDIEEPDINSLTEENSNPEQLPPGINEFPGDFALDGSGTSNKITSKSETLNNSNYLVPIGAPFSVEIYLSGRTVLSRRGGLLGPITPCKPASCSYNPKTGKRINVGDKIAVYRKVGNKNVKMPDAIVEAYPGSSDNIQINFDIPGSGIYSYGFEVTPNCNQISSPINFENNGRRSFYFYSVANKFNPTRSIRWGYMYFNGTYKVNNFDICKSNNYALNLLEDDMILKVYNYSYTERRYKVVYNEEISKCELSGTTVDISNTDCFQERDLDLSIECPDATYLLNNLYVYYKKDADKSWRYFDKISNSRLNGKSPCLDTNTKYEFGFWYDVWKTTPPLTELEMLNLYQNFDLSTICEAIKDI